jgi:hypothetical protein
MAWASLFGVERTYMEAQVLRVYREARSAHSSQEVTIELT